MDFDAIAPKVKPITADLNDSVAYETVKMQQAEDYKIDRLKHRERMEQYHQNQALIAALLIGRCSSAMKSQLQARQDWEQIEENPVLLLGAIREHSLNYDSTKYRMKVILDVMTTMLTMKQQHGEDLDDYLERHKAAKKLFLSHVGSEFTIDLLVQQDPQHNDLLKDLQK